MMIDWVSSRLRGDAAAQSIQAVRLALRGRTWERLTADWRELAAVMPHLVSSAPARGPPDRVRMATMGWMPGSGGGERVVAELGQDVAGLAEDLRASEMAARLPPLRSLTAA